MNISAIILNNKVIFMMFSIFIAVVAIIIGFKFNSESPKRKVVEIPFNNCNVQKKICSVKIDALDIEISLVRDIFYLKEFSFSILTEDEFNIEAVKINFKMKNMNMGVNTFSLIKEKSKKEKTNWKGVGLLPICVTGRADWVAMLEILTPNIKYILSFPILVKREIN